MEALTNRQSPEKELMCRKTLQQAEDSSLTNVLNGTFSKEIAPLKALWSAFAGFFPSS